MEMYLYPWISLLLVIGCSAQDDVNPFPYEASNPVCCGEQLQDHFGRAVLDAFVQVTENGMPANVIMTKFCINKPVTIQLWKQISSDPSQMTAMLKWQITINPTQQTNEWYQYEFSPAIAIDPDDRLGLMVELIPEQPDSYRLPIQYDYTPDNSRSVIMSSEELKKDNLTANEISGSIKTFNAGYRMPWSYYYFVRFCFRDREAGGELVCNVNDQQPNYVMLTGAQGPPGPPGPPGECGFPDWFQGDVIQCQADTILQDQLSNMNDVINALTNKLDGVGDISNNLIAGSCPPQWVPGSYGLGDCYFFSFGNNLQDPQITNNPDPNIAAAFDEHNFKEKQQFNVFAIWCWEHFQALPLKIESKQEENFIVSQMLKKMSIHDPLMSSIEAFTGGMWSEEQSMWTWFEPVYYGRRQYTNMAYMNWGQDEPNDPSDRKCMQVKAYGTQQYYWQTYPCVAQSYYICKKPKICF